MMVVVGVLRYPKSRRLLITSASDGHRLVIVTLFTSKIKLLVVLFSSLASSKKTKNCSSARHTTEKKLFSSPFAQLFSVGLERDGSKSQVNIVICAWRVYKAGLLSYWQSQFKLINSANKSFSASHNPKNSQLSIMAVKILVSKKVTLWCSSDLKFVLSFADCFVCICSSCCSRRRRRRWTVS